MLREKFSDAQSRKIKELIRDDKIGVDEMYDIVLDYDLGFIDGINDVEVIEMYIKDMIDQGVFVSHMLQAIEQNSDTRLFEIWLGNSMETPEPIRTKEDLGRALGFF